MYWKHSQNNVTLKGYVKFRAHGRNIVGCYTLRPFAHSVACCCLLLGVVAQKFETGQTFSYVQINGRKNAQQCCNPLLGVLVSLNGR